VKALLFAVIVCALGLTGLEAAPIPLAAKRYYQCAIDRAIELEVSGESAESVAIAAEQHCRALHDAAVQSVVDLAADQAVLRQEPYDQATKDELLVSSDLKMRSSLHSLLITKIVETRAKAANAPNK
jgi:hypothetical protein